MAEPVSQNCYISVFGRTTGMHGDNFDPIEFEGNGIAILNPSKCTITEILNGGYSLTLTHPTDSDNVWKTLYPLNFIKAQGQIFRIQSVETSYDGSSSGNVTIYAEHVTYIMNDAWIHHSSIVHGEWMVSFLDSARDASLPNGSTEWSAEKKFPNFTYNSDISFPDEYKTVQLDDFLNLQYVHDIGEGKTRYQVMMEAIQKFGGELYRDNFYFSIMNRMENSLGGDGKIDAFDIRLGENMLGIKRKVDISNFCSYFSGYTDNGLEHAHAYGDMAGFMNNIVRQKQYSDVTNFDVLKHEVASYFGYYMQPEFTYTLKLKDLRRNPDFKMLSGVRFKVGDIGRIVDERLGLSNNLRLEITQTKTNGITGEVEEITLKSISAFEWNYGSVKLPEFPDIPEPQIDETKIAVVRLDENMQKTDDVQYVDTLAEAGTVLSRALSTSKYSVVIGKNSGITAIEHSGAAFHGSPFKEKRNLYFISIPDTITRIDETAFQYCTNLREIIIPGSVSRLENQAFQYCSSLKKAVIQEGVTQIGGGVFGQCGALEEIKLPSSLTSIGSGAFASCAMTNIGLPENLNYLGNRAFANCTNLTGIEIPASVIEMTETFLLCKNLTAVKLNDGLKIIGYDSFYACENLLHVDIPESVEEIGSEAFGECISLGNVFIPKNVKKIAEDNYDINPFKGTDSISKFSISEENENYTVYQDVLYTKDMYKLIAYPIAKSRTSFAVPNGVGIIGSGSFFRSSLSEISFPETLAAIKPSAFEGNVLLNSPIFPKNLIEIGGKAFSECKNITNISLPAMVSYFGIEAFYKCSALISITIPSNVKSLVSVTSFIGCTSLKEIIVKNAKYAIPNDPWGAPNFVSTAYADKLAAEGKLIPEGKFVVYWSGADGGDEATLAEMAILKEIDSNGVVISYSISKNFRGIRSILQENPDKTYAVELGDAFNMEAREQSNVVPSDCFAGLTNVKSIYIPQRFRTIEENAFSDCTALAFVHIDKPKGEISGEPWGAPSGTVIYYSASLVTNTGDKLTIAKDTTPFAVRTTGNNAEFDTGLSGILLTNTEPEEPVENTLYLLNKSNVFKLELDGKELKL